jgi:hypothetical protein
VIDPERRQVKVSTPDGRTMTYRTGEEIPLDLLADHLAVNAIIA